MVLVVPCRWANDGGGFGPAQSSYEFILMPCYCVPRAAALHCTAPQGPAGSSGAALHERSGCVLHDSMSGSGDMGLCVVCQHGRAWLGKRSGMCRSQFLPTTDCQAFQLGV